MKKQKRVLMFAKVSAEKVSSTQCQKSRKSKSEILMSAKLNTEKGSSDDCQVQFIAVKKVQIGRRENKLAKQAGVGVEKQDHFF